ncbi:cell wall-binding repeat-containing protein [Candidatus Poriferisodalis sp.]|uniref:cell wall-binding repeat-containing protein n=1 Tax=Candidatus Poriferisodalis sp. TaxID=3101277 RepID=UPI003B01A1B0
MQRNLRALAVLLVGAVSLIVPLSAATAAGLDDVDVTRYGGADRYATSLLIAEAVATEAGGRLDTVVMVSGSSWTDAVVAAPLAGSLDAPVLATPPGELRADAARFLQRTGVTLAVLIGADSDTSGVGPAVVAELEALGITTERVTRPDQYANSVAVARRLGAPGEMGRLGRTAVVASGRVFADALVAGTFAARGGHPILLTKPEIFRRDVARYLTDRDVEHVVLMGGKAALHQVIEDAITDLGIEVTRLAGATRYDTAVEAAEFIDGRYGDGCFSPRRIGLARARVPFDSFSAGPLLARLCAPLLLADPGAVPRSTAEFLNDALEVRARVPRDAGLHVFGGNAAVSRKAVDHYLDDPLGTEGGRLRPPGPCVPGLGNEPIQVLADVFSHHAAWSPDCTKIAYTGWTEPYIGAFYIAGVDGSDPVMVFDHGAGSPAWSPDGSKIAFDRSSGKWVKGDPVSHIFVVDADGSNLVQLTSGEFGDRSPSWSPDGKRIAFARQDLNNREGIYEQYDDVFIAVVDADGSKLKTLTEGGLSDGYPAWSPDGRWIAYDRGQDLWLMDTEGRNVRRITEEYSPDGHSWSPNSTAIAYTTFAFVQDDTYSDGVRHDRTLFVTSLDSGRTVEVVRYVSRPVSNTSRGTFTIIRRPQWAPDGRSIMYERNTHMGDAARTYVAPAPAL